MKREALPPVSPPKAALAVDEVERKSKAIIEEYLHLNDMKEAVQCVQELASPSLLFIFVRLGIESTLERSTIAREHMGRLLHQLLCAGHLSTAQYYQGYEQRLCLPYPRNHPRNPLIASPRWDFSLILSCVWKMFLRDLHIFFCLVVLYFPRSRVGV